MRFLISSTHDCMYHLRTFCYYLSCPPFRWMFSKARKALPICGIRSRLAFLALHVFVNVSSVCLRLDLPLPSCHLLLINLPHCVYKVKSSFTSSQCFRFVSAFALCLKRFCLRDFCHFLPFTPLSICFVCTFLLSYTDKLVSERVERYNTLTPPLSS